MKKIITLFVTMLATFTASFTQGLSINGQDCDKSNAKLATVEEARMLYFHDQAIEGVAHYDKLPKATYVKYVPIFAKIGREGIISKMNAVNTHVGGLLRSNSSGPINLNAEIAEGWWKSHVIRMKVTSENLFSFTSVDNSLTGKSSHTKPRAFHEGEEFFVLDLTKEGYGMFILASALCCNPPEGNDLLFALQEGYEPTKGKKEDGYIPKDAEEIKWEKQVAEQVKTIKSDGGITIVFAPYVKSGDVTGGNSSVTTPTAPISSTTVAYDPEPVTKVKRIYQAADEEQIMEVYTPPSAATRTTTTTTTGSTGGGCNGCGGGYVTKGGLAPSSGAEIATATFTGAHLLYDGITDFFAPGGRWKKPAARVVNNNTFIVNKGDGGEGGGTSGGSGEMGYGIP